MFGTQDFKEGLDLYSTTYVHFLAPPESISVYEQALARAARFCSFRDVSDKTKHFYTPIIYYEDNEKESRHVFQIINQKKTPTELVLDLMKKQVWTALSMLPKRKFHVIQRPQSIFLAMMT